jgi:DNA-binding transcriptional MerR regulator
MDALLTASQAALAANVSRQLFNYWRSRGHIKPADHDDRGRPLYREREVLEVECEMRHSPNSRRVPQLV